MEVNKGDSPALQVVLGNLGSCSRKPDEPGNREATHRGIEQRPPVMWLEKPPFSSYFNDFPSDLNLHWVRGFQSELWSSPQWRSVRSRNGHFICPSRSEMSFSIFTFQRVHRFFCWLSCLVAESWCRWNQLKFWFWPKYVQNPSKSQPSHFYRKTHFDLMTPQSKLCEALQSKDVSKEERKEVMLSLRRGPGRMSCRSRPIDTIS